MPLFYLQKTEFHKHKRSRGSFPEFLCGWEEGAAQGPVDWACVSCFYYGLTEKWEIGGIGEK